MEEEKFIKVCQESQSMAQAAAKLGLHFNTFKRRAIKLNCYVTNQAGKGLKKKHNGLKIDLQEILDGNHPQYQTFNLKNRLFKEGIKENKCENEECGLSEWNGKALNCELDHIDGDRTNHRLENLQIICPNCHSQTDTFRAKNIKKA